MLAPPAGKREMRRRYWPCIRTRLCPTRLSIATVSSGIDAPPRGVSADGTIDWFCLPDYDGNVIFGALLDAQKGGYWHLGPRVRTFGTQSYVEDTTSLVTTWELREDGWS